MKLVVSQGVPTALYDLSADPFERFNLWARDPLAPGPDLGIKGGDTVRRLLDRLGG
jgi:hypothetical protein